jgi:hypothetical protein
MSPKESKGYREGKVDAELREVNRRLVRIETKLDNNLDWQQATEARLAEGAERFRALMQNDIAQVEALEDLRNSQRGVLALASTIGGAIGGGIAAAMKFFSN